jgi:hypothetical protein
MNYNFVGFHWTAKNHSSLSQEQYREAKLKACAMAEKGQVSPKSNYFSIVLDGNISLTGKAEFNEQSITFNVSLIKGL